MVEDETDGLAVSGELWKVDATGLDAIDELEGVPVLYVRRPVALQGITEPVETYLFNKTIRPGSQSGDTWPMGSYSPRTSAIV